MTPARIDLKDLPKDVRSKLNLRAPKEGKGFTAEQVRGKALDVMAVISNLTRAQRERVLKQAIKLNRVFRQIVLAGEVTAEGRPAIPGGNAQGRSQVRPAYFPQIRTEKHEPRIRSRSSFPSPKYARGQRA